MRNGAALLVLRPASRAFRRLEQALDLRGGEVEVAALGAGRQGCVVVLDRRAHDGERCRHWRSGSIGHPHNHWVLAQILSKLGKVIVGSLVIPMT
jgi:hypothetical protein